MGRFKIFFIFIVTLLITPFVAAQGSNNALKPPEGIKQSFGLDLTPDTFSEFGVGSLEILVKPGNWNWEEYYLQLRVVAGLEVLVVKADGGSETASYRLEKGKNYPKYLKAPQIKAIQEGLLITFPGWSVYSELKPKAEARFRNKKLNDEDSAWVSVLSELQPVAVYQGPLDLLEIIESEGKVDKPEVFLEKFFKGLFPNRTKAFAISMTADYRYSLTPGNPVSDVDLPIFLMAPTEFAPEIVKSMAQSIRSWYKDSQPEERGKFVFSVQVFNSTQEKRPILVIEQLLIDRQNLEL